MQPLDPDTRRASLAALVEQVGFLRVVDAALRLGVSEVTVRTDLAALEERGLVRRVHGGALRVAAPRESPVEATAARAAERKRAIGVAAAGMVRSGSSLLLDVGSTTQAVAAALVERADLEDVVVITNGLSVALALEAAVPRFTVIVTGGTLRPLQHSLVDTVAVDTLRGVHADLAIIGCTGVADGRVTNVNLPETAVKRAMVEASTTRVLVADPSKFGRRDLGVIGELAEFATVVTAGGVEDAGMPPGTRLLVAS